MTEKVSVVIPTYNREKTILRAVQSVLSQTYANLEVLVIDDGSTDGTAQIMNDIGDERVKYVVLEQNGGPSRARNIGVRMADSEWVAFQDSDDCWHNNKLEMQMAYAKEHPEYDLIYCMSMNYFQDGRKIVVPHEPLPDIMEGEMMHTLLKRNVIDTPTMLIRRKAFLDMGGFDVTYRALEDWEFVLRFSKKHLIGYCPKVLMDSFMLNGGVSSNMGAYFESRCKMLGQYRAEMMQEGMLELLMQDILMRAQQEGVIDAVKKLMIMYLSR